jgi:hypothetical protein
MVRYQWRVIVRQVGPGHPNQNVPIELEQELLEDYLCMQDQSQPLHGMWNP